MKWVCNVEICACYVSMYQNYRLYAQVWIGPLYVNCLEIHPWKMIAVLIAFDFQLCHTWIATCISCGTLVPRVYSKMQSQQNSFNVMKTSVHRPAVPVPTTGSRHFTCAPSPHAQAPALWHGPETRLNPEQCSTIPSVTGKNPGPVWMVASYPMNRV